MVDAGMWCKLQRNPLSPHMDTDEWDRHSSALHILRVGDKLRIYYYGQRGVERRIGFAEAPPDDPFTWTKRPGNPGWTWPHPGKCGFPYHSRIERSRMVATPTNTMLEEEECRREPA